MIIKMEQKERLPEGLHYTKQGTLGDLLLLIDLQNVYLEGEPWGCCRTGEVCVKLKRLLEAGAADNVIISRYLPPRNPVGTWKQYNIENKEINENLYMSEMIAAIEPYCQKYPVFTKDKYSSYTNREIARLCSMAERVLLAGVVAECCVLFTLLSGIDQGDKMVYLKDACTGVDAEYEQMVEKLAGYYAPMHTQVMTVEEYIAEKISDRKG